jgi:tetratricopeptide (TPR) repeat protein
MTRVTSRQLDNGSELYPVAARTASHFAAASILVAVLILVHSNVRAEIVMGCGEILQGDYNGPYDYTNPIEVEKWLPVVESYHFSSDVEQLVSGTHGRVDPMADIAYTLRTFPNHHRALYAMVRYQLEMKDPPTPGIRGSADCYFYYAMRLQPNDGTVLAIYGIYLHRVGRLDEALERYNQALEFASDSADLHYNLGLLYFDLSNFESSREHAIQAYDLGYPLPGLRTKLQKAGKWVE